MSKMDVECVRRVRRPHAHSDAPSTSTQQLKRAVPPSGEPSDRAIELSDSMRVKHVGPLEADTLPQYASIYFYRLTKLKPRILTRARKQWASWHDQMPQEVKRVLDVHQGQLSYIVGTIYMEMQLKPNVLEDLAKEHRLVSAPPLDKYCRPEDQIILEDDSGRVRLTGEVIEKRRFELCTGVIAGVLGAETKAGDFEVIDILFAGLPPQLKLAIDDDVTPVKGKGKEPATTDDEGYWIALASGLELGGDLDADDGRIALLTEWLTGELGDEMDQNEAAKVSRLILAGNSMRQPTKAIELEDQKDQKKPKRYGLNVSAYSQKPAAALNSFLAAVQPSLDVTILPGDRDPALGTLPQQPLHPALFPDAGDLLETVTNPAWIEHDGALLLGTSGQPLDDVFRYLPADDRLNMASSLLDWSHVAPTAPDTLFCYPFKDADPFVLDNDCPHIFFVGNQPQFGTRIIQGEEGQRVRVILVPRFASTGEIVLVNTRTLACKTVAFGAPEVY